MRRITAPERDLALYGTGASRAIEADAQASLPSHTLMRRAGEAVARLALALAPHARQVWIAAGPGNNGGDGLIAAHWLQRMGKRVAVTFAGEMTKLPPDAADAHARAVEAGVPVVAAGSDQALAATQALDADDLAIDALLGLGASRAPEGAIGELVDALNRLPCPVLAVDLPSGLNADTGQPAGSPSRCVRAHHTLALLTLKPGLYTGAGRDFAGSVWFDDLGVAPARDPDAWLTGAARAAAAGRPHAAHKGSFGDVAVIGGAAGMTGAALLAARAAHAAGAGRVWLSLLDPAAMAIDVARPELMWRNAWWKSDADVLARTTVVCGCGGGHAVAAALPRLFDEVPRLVLDADALNAVASGPELRARLAARASRGMGTVLTPHPLEAARLLETTAAAVQADRLAAAKALADRCGCVVALKGSGTVVAAPGRAPHLNPTGNAALATAGTGDVLAGWLGGLWTQQQSKDAFDATLAAVHVHGAAADRAGVPTLRAADLIEAMAKDAHRGGGPGGRAS